MACKAFGAGNLLKMIVLVRVAGRAALRRAALGIRTDAELEAQPIPRQRDRKLPPNPPDCSRHWRINVGRRALELHLKSAVETSAQRGEAEDFGVCFVEQIFDPAG